MVNKNLVSLISFIAAIGFSIGAITIIQSMNIPVLITLSASLFSIFAFILFIFIHSLISHFK